ncbi:hypothetical protein AB3Y40_18350 [Yoonia sp. R2331]|uniref:hypothetical protein n=1 Tax=Yoonia sp. R2331 TaxID=3237238 RepID=UPI0034E5D179
MKKVFLIGAACLTLAACGGGGGTTVTTPKFAPVQAHQGDGPGELELNAAGDRIKVDMGDVTTTLTAGSIASAGTFVGGRQTGSEQATAFVSATGNSRAGVAFTRNGTDPQHLSSQFARLTQTDAPTTGSATLTGDYVGILTNNNNAIGRMTGDARITANFGNDTVRGRITNREYGSLTTGNVFATVSVDDIVLEQTGFNGNGRFSGDISGGAFSTAAITGTSNGGNFAGLIAGVTGDEIVGGLQVNSTYGGQQFVEQGAFAAGH